jgi:hypothetical protein
MKYLKKFENFDTEELKNRVGDKFDKDLLKDLVDIELFKNKFNYGGYHGVDSGYLNDLLHQAKYGKLDSYNLIEELYKVLIKEIPEFKQFGVNKYKSIDEQTFSLSLNHEVEIKNENLDNNYSVKINLYIAYHLKSDEIFNYKKDKIQVLFSTKILPTKQGGNLFDIITPKQLNSIDNDKGLVDVMNTLQHKIYGSPDKDDKINDELYTISRNNLTIESFIKLIPKLKENLINYINIVENKYDVKIF